MVGPALAIATSCMGWAADGDRVGEVRFTGELGLEVNELRGALRFTRSQTVLPKIWSKRPLFSEAAVLGDRIRLQSLYVSHGYFDAQVLIGKLEKVGNKTNVRYAMNAGPRFDVAGVGVAGKSFVDSDGGFPVRELCKCLLEKRNAAWREGRVDFRVALRAKRSDTGLDITASLEPGSSYKVGRIDFRGHHSIRDATIRRTMLIEENHLFNPHLLFRSLRRLNSIGTFEPVSGESVQMSRNGQTVNLTIQLKEQSQGRWTIAGPLGPPGVAGPLQAAVFSRLPAWGPPVLQASTIYASLGVTLYSYPVFRLLGWETGTSLAPLVGIGRNYLPGEGWLSGFYLSPQLSWQEIALRYGATQLRYRGLGALGPNTDITPGLLVPVHRGAGRDNENALLCEPHQSRWGRLRAIAAQGADLALSGIGF